MKNAEPPSGLAWCGTSTPCPPCVEWALKGRASTEERTDSTTASGRAAEAWGKGRWEEGVGGKSISHSTYSKTNFLYGKELLLFSRLCKFLLTERIMDAERLLGATAARRDERNGLARAAERRLFGLIV